MGPDVSETLRYGLEHQWRVWNPERTRVLCRVHRSSGSIRSPLPSTRLCSSLATQSDPRQGSSVPLLPPLCLKHIRGSSCLHRDTRHKAKNFGLLWFSSIVSININPRRQVPLRVEACRLPRKKSTLGIVLCTPSFKLTSLPGYHHLSMCVFLG